MPDDGVSLPNIPPSSMPTHVLGYRDLGDGAWQAVRSTVPALANQLAPYATKGTFATRAELNANLNFPANAGAEVWGDTPANNGVYRKSGASGEGAWTRISGIPAMEAVELVEQEIETRTRLIVDAEYGEVEIADDRGFAIGRIGAAAANLGGRSWIADPGMAGEAVTDVYGFGTIAMDADGVRIAGAGFAADANEVGLVVCDPHGFLLLRIDGVPQEDAPVEDAPDLTPYFSGTLCGAQGRPVPIFLRNLRAQRSDTALAFGTIASTDSGNPYARGDTDEVLVDTAALGATAVLSMRGPDPDRRLILPLTVKTAPVPAISPTTVNVLVIGDSIVNRQGAYLLKQYLEAWGYLPNFIGTMYGSGASGSTADVTGPLGEGREGWETGDFTFAVNNRAIYVPPGGEAAYLALPKTDQRERNVFVREATGGDDPSIVRNGYVLDFAHYQSRFSLPTPHIVLYGAGTNDIRDLSAGVIHEAVYANDVLFLSQMRAAWPAAKIIRFMPGTSRSVSRDGLWTPEYIPVIRAMMRAKAALADPLLTIAPTWAMMTQDIGYTLSTVATDPVTGAVTGAIDDDIHPIGCARAQLYHALAGYVACAAANLI
ncbi:hypothetical protein ACLBXM_20050 [Xanthobacteraceae bacterium A53D]